MKRATLLLLVALICALPIHAQWTTVTATKITDGRAGNHMLPSGKLCFTAVDSNGNAIGIKVGGGGQSVLAPFCASVTSGVVGTLLVPDAAQSAPVVAYKIEVSDGHAVVRRDITSGGIVTGTTWNYDDYVPNIGAVATSKSVDSLTVGTLTITKSCNGPCGGGGGGGGASYSFIPPLSLSDSTVSIPKADASHNGYLSFSDWLAFNNKQSAIGYQPERVLTFSAPLSRATNTISIDLSNYITSSALTTILNGYATTSSLSNYVTPASLAATLNGYAPNSALANYALISSLPQSKTCPGSDKFSGYDSSTHQFTCGPDQTGTAGTGITSLDGSTAVSQSFADGTNVHVSTNTATGVHTIAFTGTLPQTKGATSGQPILSYDAITGLFTQGALTSAQVGALPSSTVLPSNTTATAHYFFTSYNSATGAFNYARPSCGDLSDSGSLCTSSAALPSNTAATAHYFLTAYNNTTGSFSAGRPACSDLADSGTLCSSSAALAQNYASSAHKWLASYSSATGSFTQTQPNCSDISDAGNLCTHNVAEFQAAGNYVVQAATASGHYLRNSGSGYVDSTIQVSDVPVLTPAKAGLGNVTNDAQVKRSEMGIANGVPTLGADGKVPSGQLPAMAGGENWVGVWNQTTAYVASTHDAVTYQGSSFVAIANSTNQVPCSVTPCVQSGVNTTYWQTVALAGANGSLSNGVGPTLIQGVAQAATSVTLDTGLDYGLFLGSDGKMHCQLASGSSCMPATGTGTYTPPTGTGFTHVTSGAQDAAAKLVDLATDMTATTLPDALLPNKVTAGTCGDATHVCQHTVDVKGRVTAQTEVSISAVAGLADPGANGIVKRTAVNTTAAANYSDFFALFSGCSGAMVPGYDGTCHSLTASGMANPMTVVGDVIYGLAGGNPSRLAGNTSTTPKYLASTGDGTNATAPIWKQPDYNDLANKAPIPSTPSGVGLGSVTNDAQTKNSIVPNTFTGLRKGNGGTADTAATSADVQAVIGSGVYDASGAATTAANAKAAPGSCTLPNVVTATTTGGVTCAQPTNITGTAANITATSNSTLTTLSSLSLPYSQLTSAPTIPVASSTTPAMNGTGAVGTGTTWARSDHVHPSDTSRAPVASPTFTGKVTTSASATGGAGLNLPHGVAPTTPVNGDCWTTTAGLYCYINGATVGPYAASSGSGIANVQITVGTTAVAANTCTAASTATMTGLATTSTITLTPSTDVSAVTGWSPATTGQLYFTTWATANTLNWKVCNPTNASLTPGASTTWNGSAK